MDHDANPRYERKNLIQMAAIVVVVSAIGIALALTIHWFPTQASVEGEKIDTLYDVLLVISVPIFVLVASVVLLLGVAIPHAAGRGDSRTARRSTATPGSRSSGPRFPAVLLVSLCSYAYAVLHDIEKSQAQPHDGARSPASSSPGRYSIRTARAASPCARTSSTCPTHKQIQFDVHAPGRPPRLLGAGLPHEDRRRAGHHHPCEDDAEEAR